MPASLHKWKPPDQEFLKINVDGSFRKEDKSGACGYIVRNHLGEPVLVGAANISPVLDVLTAETMACLFALESAQRAGI
jgi:ribonuclease HI